MWKQQYLKGVCSGKLEGWKMMGKKYLWCKCLKYLCIYASWRWRCWDWTYGVRLSRNMKGHNGIEALIGKQRKIRYEICFERMRYFICNQRYIVRNFTRNIQLSSDMRLMKFNSQLKTSQSRP